MSTFSTQNDVFQILGGPTFFVPWFRDRIFVHISQKLGECHTPPPHPPNVRPWVHCVALIEIINNTRGGIEGEIGERVNGGQIYCQPCKSDV